MIRHLRPFALAAALLGAAALPAFAADTRPVATPGATAAMPQNQANPDTSLKTQNNAQAGISDVGANPAPNTQVAANMSTGTGMGISAEPSPTQRKATHTASQRAKADAAEAETTKQLNQQAAELARPDTMVR